MGMSRVSASHAHITHIYIYGGEWKRKCNGKAFEMLRTKDVPRGVVRRVCVWVRGWRGTILATGAVRAGGGGRRCARSCRRVCGVALFSSRTPLATTRTRREDGRGLGWAACKCRSFPGQAADLFK